MKRPRQYFRAGVGAVITDGRGRVLVFQRAHIPGAWQFPQGGMDDRERPIDTAYREVEEETGIPRRALQLMDRHPDLLAYELPARSQTPKTGRGQVQYWFLFRLKAPAVFDSMPHDAEFSAHRWVSFNTAVAQVVRFKRPLYRRVRDRFARAVGRRPTTSRHS
jgi:putative (di)nucleoside polyphosphate hydrolase